MRVLYLAAFVMLFMPSAAGAQGYATEALRTVSKIDLDGRLDEAVWQSTSVLILTQQSPQPGGPTSFLTEGRVIVTGEALYIGVRCVDPQPERVAVHTMRRDGDLSGDDQISIVLDTFGDRRTGYFFQINAAAARVDGLISDPESVSLDWDGVWDARTARTTNGWTAEIMIPARTLTFSRNVSSWGLNIDRFIPRQRLSLRWASPTRDAFFYDLSRAGSLTGITGLEQGKGIEIAPYVTGRTTDLFAVRDRAWQATGGGELSWRMTPQLLSVLTVNTDFSETDVDTRQINITRFPLFFPEKRAFFLEGAHQFTFGLGLGTNFIPFFSRRIGLLRGTQIPLSAGGKLHGRIGNWNVAVLDVQTREAHIGTDLVPGTNLLAARISYDVTSKLRVGTLVTHGDPEAQRSNTLTGLDAVWRTSTLFGDKNFLVGGWTARSEGDVLAGSRQGWGYKADFPNDLVDCAHTLDQFGVALDPALGFLPRPGTRRFRVSCSLQPRPSKEGPFRWIRQAFFENQFVRVIDEHGTVESWEFFFAPVNVRMETGDRFEFNWVPNYELLRAHFEISPGVTIPQGEYRFDRYRLEAQTSPHRPFQFGHTVWWGDFYSGDLTEWGNYIKWTSPQGRLQLEFTAQNNFGHLPTGNFVQRLWQLQSAYAWNPNLILSSFIQYDHQSRNLGSNTRLRWTIKPGRDIYLVWNRSWRQALVHPDSLGLRPDSDLIAVKLRWTFRY
jgi:hypothetical protein